MSVRIEHVFVAPPTTCWCCKNHLSLCMCWATVGPTYSEHCTPEDHRTPKVFTAPDGTLVEDEIVTP